MCEDTKCMHHREGCKCAQGLKMTCTRRMKKLGLKVGYWNRPRPKEPLFGTLEIQ